MVNGQWCLPGWLFSRGYTHETNLTSIPKQNIAALGGRAGHHSSAGEGDEPTLNPATRRNILGRSWDREATHDVGIEPIHDTDIL